MVGVDVSEIDAVIARLDEIIDEAIASDDRMGWFAAMYHRVTVAVKDGILAGRFVDGERMARFDKIFADRFVEAWDNVQAGRPTTESWQVAFDGAKKRRLVIVQQLLLGMNAHINLDLGIAAAAVARERGEDVQLLKPDFLEINKVLAALTDGFVVQVGELSPWFGLIDRIGGRADDSMIRFSIDIARDEAWRLTTDIAADDENRERAIKARDVETAKLGRIVARPGVVLPVVLLAVRAREPNDVNRVTRFLREAPPVVV